MTRSQQISCLCYKGEHCDASPRRIKPLSIEFRGWCDNQVCWLSSHCCTRGLELEQDSENSLILTVRKCFIQQGESLLPILTKPTVGTAELTGLRQPSRRIPAVAATGLI